MGKVSINEKVLIIGGNGMLGHKLLSVLRPEFDVFVTVRDFFKQYEEFDLFSRDRTFDNLELMRAEPLCSVVRELDPAVVINAAGIIKNVPSSSNAVETITINSILPHRLAMLSNDLGFRLISIGTDCVFNGAKGHYREDETPDARDMYGKSKALGEVTDINCLTLRTSIIGRELGTRRGLLEWFLGNRNGSVDGYANAIFSGFPTVVFSRIIKDILLNHADLVGLYHVSSDPISKLELLELINVRFATNVNIKNCEDHQINRSLNSDRFRQKTGFQPLPWPEMIEILAVDSAGYETT